MEKVLFGSKKLQEALDKGFVVSFPTETVYGLGIRWDSYQGFLNLASVKHRSVSKPVSVMCGRNFDFDKYFYISSGIKRVIDTFLPGPLTILLKAKGNVPWQTHLGTDVVGIRVPDSPKLLDFLDSLPYPLQVTSANIASEPPLTDFNEVYYKFKNEELIRYIVNFDSPNSKIPTTIVSFADNNIKMIREGEIRLEAVMKVYKGE